ncbi:aminotransferase class V-fold PLP-dependent enzyme [Nesterenkonia ebinurensis]|uniref:aminotransferase class V-fold PLP-dependent enzyme n=1 Tax=Nesterenkonia ebinurensis TaxID=2608252 RepID=UPI00168A42C6|nr:aminotransferase class V-fold PLP-dependent enzyme [Nesterenkonia ebinurensis]
MAETPEKMRSLFPAEAARYLDTPSMGVPPKPTTEAVRQAVEAWASASARFEDWDQIREECRPLIAAEFAVDPEHIALIPSVVPAVAYVGEQVSRRRGLLLAHRSEFRSLLLPLMQAFGEDRLRWVSGPYTTETFLHALDENVAAVAVSTVSSHDGARPDLTRLSEACRTAGAELLVDATQSMGVVELGFDPQEAALVASAGYKGLLAPRGTGYAVIRPDFSTEAPSSASPYGMVDTPQVGSYGPPLLPRQGGARLDQSPAWLSWVGAQTSLAALGRFSLQDRQQYVLSLAERLRHGLQQADLPVPASDLSSPIITYATKEPRPVLAALERAGVRASVRRGALRFGFHIYVEDETVDLVQEILLREQGQIL